MTDTKATPEADKTYPPSQSKGPDNAYYLRGCPIVQHQPSYAACLNKIGETEAGRFENVINKECEAAIGGKGCPALNMQQEEQLAGKALFYFPRQYIRNQVITSLTPASEIPKKSAFGLRVDRAKTPLAPIASAPAPASTSAPTLDDHISGGQEDGYAAAINAAIKEAAEPPKRPPEPPKAKPAPIAPVAPKVAAAPRPAMLSGETPLQYARRISAAVTV